MVLRRFEEYRILLARISVMIPLSIRRDCMTEHLPRGRFHVVYPRDVEAFQPSLQRENYAIGQSGTWQGNDRQHGG